MNNGDRNPNIGEQVHWHEGLFLQPQHLQLMQRQLLEATFMERRLMCSYPYGVIEGRLQADALQNMMIAFDRLKVIMPSGLPVWFPENADLPSLNIEELFHETIPFMVYLAVPTWYASRANTLETNGNDDWRAKRLYRVAETRRHDENSGRDPQPVLVRRLNARLMVRREDRPELDDLTDLEVMPLLRVVPSVTEQDVGVPRQDPNYVPPSLLLSSSPELTTRVRDLHQHVEVRRRELLAVMKQVQFNIETVRGDQFAQVLRLRVYGYYAGRLPQLLAAPATTPFDMYLELRGFLSELAALMPDNSSVHEAAPYNHNSPMLAFEELCAKIRNLLVPPKSPILKVDFRREGNWLAARLEEPHLIGPTDYYLAIATKQDSSRLKALVENGNSFKLMPLSDIKLEVYGVKLVEERYPPLQLPQQPGLNYFRLIRSEGRAWDKVRQQRALAVRWPEMETSDFRMALFMTLPSDVAPPAPANPAAPRTS